MQQQVQLPTLADLESALTQMSLQRAALKDQIDQIERQMPVVAGQVQLLRAQAEVAKEAEGSNDSE